MSFIARLFSCLPMAACCLMAGLLSGCATVRNPQVVLGPKYKPTNVHRLASFIPPIIRRVAVLPISTGAEDWQGEVDRVNLQSVVQTELAQAKRFELVAIPSAQLRTWTGRPTWRSDDVLPSDFMKRLKETYDCDAALFVHLSTYHPYKPIVIGWNMKLIEATGRYVVWAVDETFDSNDASVSNAAQYYFLTHTPGHSADPERSAVLMSPRQFAEYTLDAVFETLPAR